MDNNGRDGTKQGIISIEKLIKLKHNKKYYSQCNASTVTNLRENLLKCALKGALALI